MSVKDLGDVNKDGKFDKKDIEFTISNVTVYFNILFSIY